MQSRIVVGFNATASSLDAVCWAGERAVAHGAALMIVTCRDDFEPDGTGSGPDPLAAAVATVRHRFPSLAVTATAVDEPPCVALAAAANGSRLLVVGPATHVALGDEHSGRLIQVITSSMPCPVAVVRGPSAPVTPAPPTSSEALPLHGSPAPYHCVQSCQRRSARPTGHPADRGDASVDDRPCAS